MYGLAIPMLQLFIFTNPDNATTCTTQEMHAHTLRFTTHTSPTLYLHASMQCIIIYCVILRTLSCQAWSPFIGQPKSTAAKGTSLCVAQGHTDRHTLTEAYSIWSRIMGGSVVLPKLEGHVLSPPGRGGPRPGLNGTVGGSLRSTQETSGR